MIQLVISQFIDHDDSIDVLSSKRDFLRYNLTQIVILNMCRNHHY